MVAAAERTDTQQRVKQPFPAVSARLGLTEHRPPAPRVRWLMVAAAVGGGTFLGAVALLAMHLLSAHRGDAKSISSAGSATSAIVAPMPASPPSAPVPKSASSVVVNPESEGSVAVAQTASEPSQTTQPQHVAQHEPQPPTSAAASVPRAAALAKPVPHKAKAPAGKLPFSSDELTF